MKEASGSRCWALCRLCVLLISGLFLSSCTRTMVPMGTKIVALPTLTTQPQFQVSPTPSIEIETDQYAVVWVTHEETLIIRKPAGISGTAVSELAYDQRGIKLTGSSTLLGSSTWVEIYTPAGGAGWVNSWNLRRWDSLGMIVIASTIPAILNVLAGEIQAAACWAPCFERVR